LKNKLTLILAQDKLSYCSSIQKNDKTYDVIVIDGHWRLYCAEMCISHLSEGGVIILDNSDWCPKTCDFLMKQGFSRLDFSGFGASNQFTWSTSLFFHSCLNPILNPVKLPSSLGYVSPDDSGYMFEGEDK
jgi:spermidine synthase